MRRERIGRCGRQVHAASHGIYGSGKIAKKLAQSDYLETACSQHGARAIGRMGLASRVSKASRRPRPGRSDEATRRNTLDRDFTANQPIKKWVTDISICRRSPVGFTWAVVLDLSSRKVVVGPSALAGDAAGRRRPATSDRSQAAGRKRTLASTAIVVAKYTSDCLQQTLRTLGSNAR